MTGPNQAIGRYGENIAANHLESLSFEILERNFYTRSGEIDIIARSADALHFVEVKTRIGISHGQPYEAVTPRKISHLLKAARFYVLKNHFYKSSLSLDVISIVLDSYRNVLSLKYYRNITA